MLFVLLLLGIVTIDQLYRFKNGGNTATNIKTPTDVNFDNMPSSGTTETNIVQ